MRGGGNFKDVILVVVHSETGTDTGVETTKEDDSGILLTEDGRDKLADENVLVVEVAADKDEVDITVLDDDAVPTADVEYVSGSVVSVGDVRVEHRFRRIFILSSKSTPVYSDTMLAS